MSKVVSIISQKGGVGKSTLSVLLANCFAFHFNLKIAIIDADFPQHSIYKRRRKELSLVEQNPRLNEVFRLLYPAGLEPYPIIATNLDSCHSFINRMYDEVDLIFVDVTGSVNQPAIASFLNQVHHFLIPVLQDEFSIVSAVELYHLIVKEVQPVSPRFGSCSLFFNRVPRRHQLPLLFDQLKPHFNCLEVYLSDYAVYERSYRSTVFPIPKAKPEAQKLLEFASSVKLVLEETGALV
jgi:chromosome partitioning protein